MVTPVRGLRGSAPKPQKPPGEATLQPQWTARGLFASRAVRRRGWSPFLLCDRTRSFETSKNEASTAIDYAA